MKWFISLQIVQWIFMFFMYFGEYIIDDDDDDDEIFPGLAKDPDHSK